MLFSQLPIFYCNNQLWQRQLSLCTLYTLQIKFDMLPSPASSLSSFRDYYRHTSQASDDLPSGEELLLQGLTNFKIVKVFARLNWRLTQEQYWACFYAFRKTRTLYSRKDNHARATVLFGKLLRKSVQRKSKLVVQVNCLNQMLENVRQARRMQLARLLHFGMKFMKKNYINAAFCLQKFKNNTTKQQRTNVQTSKIIARLRRAVLCIVVRSILVKRMFVIALQFREKLRAWNKNSQQISFFKPKKEKSHEHKRSNETQRLFKASKIAQIIQKKMYIYQKTFLTNIMLARESESQQQLSDSTEIFANVAQHMIYLTSAMSKLQSTTTKSQMQEIRQFKLAQILKKDRRRRRENTKECLRIWRRAVNQQHLQLRRQILKLEMIKKHYMDEF